MAGGRKGVEVAFTITEIEMLAALNCTIFALRTAVARDAGLCGRSQRLPIRLLRRLMVAAPVVAEVVTQSGDIAKVWS